MTAFRDSAYFHDSVTLLIQFVLMDCITLKKKNKVISPGKIRDMQSLSVDSWVTFKVSITGGKTDKPIVEPS